MIDKMVPRQKDHPETVRGKGLIRRGESRGRIELGVRDSKRMAKREEERKARIVIDKMVPRQKGHLETARHNPYREDGKERSRKKERYHARGAILKLHVKTRIHTRGTRRGDRARVRKIARESKRMAKRGQGRKKGTTPEGPS
jgi:hypothetical protein